MAVMSAVPVAYAGDQEDRAADQLFGYSYGEAPPAAAAASGAPAAPSTDASASKPGADRLELEFRGSDDSQFFDTDQRRGTAAHQYGIAGIGTGSSMIGLGAVVFLGSRFLDKGSTERTATAHGGLTLLGLGGLLFITGAIFIGVDSAKAPPKHPVPTPTADGRGAQLTYAFTF